jgi:hypothetical protein
VPRIETIRSAGTNIAAAGPQGVRSRSDDSEQPENQDQDQQAAKADVHDVPPVMVLLLKRCAARPRSTRYACDRNAGGIVLPISKGPDFLDF